MVSIISFNACLQAANIDLYFTAHLWLTDLIQDELTLFTFDVENFSF